MKLIEEGLKIILNGKQPTKAKRANKKAGNHLQKPKRNKFLALWKAVPRVRTDPIRRKELEVD